MSTRETPASAAQWLMTAGILTFSLIAGVVIFAAIVLLVLRSGRLFEGEWWSPTGTLTLVGLGTALAMIVLSMVLPPLIERRALASRLTGPVSNEVTPGFEDWGPGAAELLPVLMTGHIVRLALLEGAALLNLIVYIQEGKVWSLVAAGVLIVLMISTLMTETRVRGWLETARETSQAMERR
jgi:hypothetical protein